MQKLSKRDYDGSTDVVIAIHLRRPINVVITPDSFAQCQAQGVQKAL